MTTYQIKDRPKVCFVVVGVLRAIACMRHISAGEREAIEGLGPMPSNLASVLLFDHPSKPHRLLAVYCSTGIKYSSIFWPRTRWSEAHCLPCDY